MPITYTITPASAAEPVTLDEAKINSRVDSSYLDAKILEDITAARELIEGNTGRRLMPATAVEYFDRFPWYASNLAHQAGPHGQIDTRQLRLSVLPVRSVTSIGYVDTNCDAQTVSASSYRTDVVSEPARIEQAYGTVWPATRQESNAVTVTYEVGYASAAAVPKSLKQLILMLVDHWINNPGATSDVQVREMPLAAQRLIDRWAVYSR